MEDMDLKKVREAMKSIKSSLTLPRVSDRIRQKERQQQQQQVKLVHVSASELMDGDNSVYSNDLSLNFIADQFEAAGNTVPTVWDKKNETACYFLISRQA